MGTKRSRRLLAALAWVPLTLISCSAPAALVQGGVSLLPPCPGTPNCVCSDDPHPARRIDPLLLAAAPDAAWTALGQVVSALPRVTVVRSDAAQFQAEVRSRLFGFVDDIAFQLRPADGVIAVRSAARTGYSDLGVNRRRVEEIRRQLQAAGVVK